MGLATERAVLIRYSLDGQMFVGSGLRVRDRYVLTANHCTQGSDHEVELVDGSTYQASVHVRSDDVDADLAVLVLEADAPAVEQLLPARVDRAAAAELTGAQALGYPRWKRGDSDARIMAQLDGYIPTAEGLLPGQAAGGLSFLEFKGTGPIIRDHPTPVGRLDQSSPWGGMSGAGVVIDNKVLGVIRSHNRVAGGMSLTVTPLTAVADLPESRAAKFTDALGLPDLEHWAVLPDEITALARTTLKVLDEAGRPPLGGQVDAGIFGARKARTDIDLHGDPYYPYVPREADSLVAAALGARIEGSDHRLLLLVGEAMAGKSRTGAHALQTHPATQHLPLLVPTAGPCLEQVADLAALLCTDANGPGGAVLWLNDLNEYYAWLTETMAFQWREAPGLIVVATVRRDELATLQDRSELRATWDFINDDEQVEQVELPAEWSDDDQAGLAAAPGWVQDAVASGTPLGEVLGSARELLLKLKTVDPQVRALVEVVVDWHRTGIPGPLPPAVARELWLSYLPRRAAAHLAALPPQQAEQRFHESSAEACTPIPGTYAALLTHTDEGLRGEDLLVDQRTNHAQSIQVPVWEAAL
ncbi:trypsin-like peptidase domain-containing protein, partial [Georgenia sp. 10Sc9-8]|nr:trypsin-like peptidase domain-containing protein [Georgenia halotolerans]